MSTKVALKGVKRDVLGSSESRRLRKAGMIPAVIYGKNDPVHLAVDAKEFSNEVKSISESSIITIKIGRKSYSVLIKDYQGALFTDSIMHLDFFEVVKGETLHTTVNITLVGSSKGVKDGGLLEHVLHEVEIECLPKDIPDAFSVDINELGLNESIHVKDLSVPKGVKLLINEDRTVVTVVSKKAETEETPEEEEVEETEGE